MVNEDRRLELARAAQNYEALQSECEQAADKICEARLHENKRHKTALDKFAERTRTELNPLQAKLGAAQKARSEIKAHYVERGLVTAEAEARWRVAKLQRGVRTREGDLQGAKAAAKKLSKRDKKAGTRLQKDLVLAESELAEEQAKLAEALSVLKVASDVLEAAITEALRVPAGA